MIAQGANDEEVSISRQQDLIDSQAARGCNSSIRSADLPMTGQMWWYGRSINEAA